MAELSTEFPGSVHVHDIGLGAATDSGLWDYAPNNGFVIVLQNSKFADLSVLNWVPPKID